jgi:hypothetical protein
MDYSSTHSSWVGEGLIKYSRFTRYFIKKTPGTSSGCLTQKSILTNPLARYVYPQPTHA